MHALAVINSSQHILHTNSGKTVNLCYFKDFYVGRYVNYREDIVPVTILNYLLSPMCVMTYYIFGCPGRTKVILSRVSLGKLILKNSTHIISCVADAAAAKSLQLCPTLCNPIEGSPPGSPVPGILQARTLEWVAISFSNA